MAAHKLRTGALRVCFECKSFPSGHNKDQCMTSDPEIADVIVCHCPCQPRCTEPKCQPENIKTGRRKQYAGTCPKCTIAHAGPCY